MKPIKTKHTNVVYGKNQEEYQQLPAFKNKEGTVVTCWELSDEALKSINETRRIYLIQHTFNQALQPIRLDVDDPVQIEE